MNLLTHSSCRLPVIRTTAIYPIFPVFALNGQVTQLSDSARSPCLCLDSRQLSLVSFTPFPLPENSMKHTARLGVRPPARHGQCPLCPCPCFGYPVGLSVRPSMHPSTPQSACFCKQQQAPLVAMQGHRERVFQKI